ncbi:XdhC family protein [Sporosarcina sp. CAU 1771]
MLENALVYKALAKNKEMQKKSALATVVRVYGSAYRREGAKMLIDEDENRTGMISGGCLESDVAEIAKQVIETGKPELKFYDMDEDLVWGLGLGCPGKVEIYIEPIS